MQNKAINLGLSMIIFFTDHIPAIIGICVLSAFYTFEISFGTVLLYMFALFGFLFTFGLLVVAAVGFFSKETLMENEQLKNKVQRLVVENEKLKNKVILLETPICTQEQFN